MMLVLQFLDGTTHVPERDEAYVRVRLTEAPPPSAGAVTVYLADGTALVVCEHDLVRIERAENVEE